MTEPGTIFRRGIMAMPVLGLGITLALVLTLMVSPALTPSCLGAAPTGVPVEAGNGDGGDFAALQTDAKRTFRKDIEPFVKTYCADCHGARRMKAGLNFAPALKN